MTKLNKQIKQLIDQSVDQSLLAGSNGANQSLFLRETGMQNGLYAYQEEDSYMNPSNVSKINQSGFYND